MAIYCATLNYYDPAGQQAAYNKYYQGKPQIAHNSSIRALILSLTLFLA